MSYHATLRTANLKRDAEYDPEGLISLTYRGLELAGEVGELANLLKKLRRSALNLPGNSTNLEEIADEIADVLISLDLLAMDLGLNLKLCVVNKFNATSSKLNLQTKLMSQFDLADSVSDTLTRTRLIQRIGTRV